MANVLTRIQNNQITDSSIQGEKITTGTLTGNLFASSLTLNSNVTILGNLTVANSYTQLNSINTYINDPIVVFNNGYTGSLSGYDMGILINRNLSSLGAYGSVNTFFGWVENDQAFEAIATTETGTSVSSINNSGYANIKVGNITAVTGTFSGNVSASYFLGNIIGTTGVLTTLTATNGTVTNLSSGNAQITGGAITSTPISGSTGYFTTAQATNFSSGNVLLTGGNITGITTLTATNGTVTNLSSGNATITGGSVNGAPIGASSASTGAFTTLTTTGIFTSSGNIVAASGVTSNSPTTGALVVAGSGGAGIGGPLWVGGILNVAQGATLQSTLNVTGATTLSTAVVAGLQATAIGNVTPGTGAFTTMTAAGLQATAIGNVTPGTAVFTTETVAGLQAQAIGNVTPGTGNFTTVTAANFASGNAVITGGTLSGISSANLTTLTATNFASGNIQGTGGTLSGMTAGNFTTLQGTNFSSGNAQITSGNITGITTLTATTAQATNFSSGNIQGTGGTLSGMTAGNFTTLQGTNFSSSNVQATGGTLSGMTAGNFTTLQGTNFSSGNARISGGYADSFPIGANTAATGAFTTLTASGVTTLTQGGDATSTTSGALRVTGGAGITGNLWVGGNIYASSIVGTTTSILTIQDPLVYLQATNPLGAYNYDIGFYSDYSAPMYAHTGLARNVNANVWTFFSNVASEPNATTVNWNDTGLIYDTVKAGALILANSTAASSTTTGALQVSGGAGIVGNLYAGNVNAGTTLTATNGQFTSIYGTFYGTVSGTGATANVSLYENVQTTSSASTFYPAFYNATTGNLAAYTNSALSFRPSDGYLFTTVACVGAVYGDSGTITTLRATNFSTGNAVITGGSVNGAPIGASSASTGAFTTLQSTTAVSTNFSSGNAVITGGSVNGAPIGASSASTGAFTTLTTTGTAIASGNIVAASGTTSTSVTTGALVVAGSGGLGVGGNINVGQLTSLHAIRGNVLIGQGSVQASADSALTINQNTDTPLVSNAILHISGQSGKNTIYGADSFGTGNVSIFSGRHARGTSASPTAVQQYDIYAGFVGQGYGSTTYSSSSPGQRAGMFLRASENYTDTAQGTDLLLSTVTSGDVISKVALNIGANGTSTFTSNAVSTSGSSGAVVVNGGVGIGGALNVAGTSTFNGISTHLANVVISAQTDTTSTTTGALILTGNAGLSVAGNAYVGNNMYIGSTAMSQQANFANPTIIAIDSGSNYAQMALKNTSNTGSADYAAYSDSGTDAGGWVDMGIAGTAFNDGNYTITKPEDGYLFVKPTTVSQGGNLVLATSQTGSYNDIVVGVGSFHANAEVARFHGNTSNNGYLDIKVGTNATAATNGAVRITNGGGLGVTGNVFLANAVTINSTRTSNQDFYVKGVNDSALVWARPNSTYDQVVIGGNLAVGDLSRGAKLIVSSTDSMILPTGTTAQRPSSAGYSDVAGMFRYNTTLGFIEFYNGSSWQGVSTQFTVITDEQFTGTGSQTAFTLGAASTTASTIVSINGVMQIPSLAYSVSGATMTFTEAPATNDIIDVRRLTTTQQITSFVSTNGYMGFIADNTGANITTGTSSQTVTTSFDTSGAQVSYIPTVSVASANTPTTIDTFDATKYRAAKYVVTVTNSTNYQVTEVLVVHNGTTATRSQYGTMDTNGNLGVTSVTISGSNVLLQYIAANATNTVRIKKDYIAI